MEDDAESSSGLREIIIEVLGEPAFRKYGLQRVRQEVSDLHRLWFRSIHADEMVPCCCEQYCKKSPKPHLHKLEKLQQAVSALSENKKAALKEMISELPVPETEAEKSSVGTKMMNIMNSLAIPIVHEVTGSV